MFKWFLLVLSALALSVLISLAPFCFPSFYANALVPPSIHGHKKSWIYFVWLGLSLFCAFLSPLKITYSYLFKPNNDIALVHSVCTVDGPTSSLSLYNNFAWQSITITCSFIVQNTIADFRYLLHPLPMACPSVGSFFRLLVPS